MPLVVGSSHFWKSSSVTFNVTVSAATDYNVHSALISAGWNGSTPVTATITNTGVIQASATNTYAFSVSGTFPNGSNISIINQAGSYIVGKGGDGVAFSNGTSGGTALYIATGTGASVSITNNGTVGGGGGGGGSLSPGATAFFTTSGNGTVSSPGSVLSAGSGGAGFGVGVFQNSGTQFFTSGSGGTLGSAGAAAPDGTHSGGAGGAATAGAANATWLVTGTRLGTIG